MCAIIIGGLILFCTGLMRVESQCLSMKYTRTSNGVHPRTGGIGCATIAPFSRIH